jgi:rhodanese-related sulfurtransferase
MKVRVPFSQQVITILLFSVGIGLFVNTLRSTPLPPIGDWPHGAFSLKGERSVPTVPLEDAVVKFLSGEAFFLDPRSEADYQVGHIQGALNLPVGAGNFGERLQEFSLVVDRKKELIVYCDGIGCALGPELASILKGLGYRNVSVFINGWTEWMMAGMPFEAM